MSVVTRRRSAQKTRIAMGSDAVNPTGSREHCFGSLLFFFFKQKTAFELDCDWSSDVCSSDLQLLRHLPVGAVVIRLDLEVRCRRVALDPAAEDVPACDGGVVAIERSLGAPIRVALQRPAVRSEERRVGKEAGSGDGPGHERNT